MIPQGALVLYKNKPAVAVSRDADRIGIKLADGSILRVRDKDVQLLHNGPVSAIPDCNGNNSLAGAGDADFETARTMILMDEAATLRWKDMAELVFGASGPQEVLACFYEAEKGLLFKLVDGQPVAMDDAAVEEIQSKRRERAEEETARAAFIARARSASALQYPADARYCSELEALAYGKTSKSRIAKEIGIQETPESAHAFLLKTGLWSDMTNPWPQRSGLALSLPRACLPEPVQEQGRQDLRHLCALAIDNEGSHDPDDAISIDGTMIWVHIADPASAIIPGDPVDRAAMERGATLYLPERIVPMLPESAVPRFGLGLAEESVALSFGITLKEDASVDSLCIVPSRIRVRRMTYAQADALLSAGGKDADTLEKLDSIASRRRSWRKERGAVDIDIPEVDIRVRDGSLELVPQARHRSAAIVREMMLLCGEAAARWAFGQHLAFPFYGQEEPQLEESLRIDDTDVAPPLSVQFARRRGMRAGMLGPTPAAHRGLGLPFYAQVTSPLRRYQDLLAHMQLRAQLALEAQGGGTIEGAREVLCPARTLAALDADEVMRRCAIASAGLALNRQAERDSTLFWTAVYLLRHPDWQGDAIVVQILSAGPARGSHQHRGQTGAAYKDFVCYIPALGIETRIKSRSDYALDDTLRLRLTQVSIPERDSSFDIVRSADTVQDSARD